MDDIELCVIPEETLPENRLQNFEKSTKADSNKVIIVKTEAKHGDTHSTTSKLCLSKMKIKQDIPEDFRTIVQNVYNLCIFHNVVNLANFFFAVFDVKTTISIASTVGYGVIYFIFSYFVCLQFAYRTFTLKCKCCFITFLAAYCVEFLLSCVQTAGAHNTISTGFISALETSRDVKFYSNYKMIAELIIALVCGWGAIIDFIVMVMVINMYSKIMNFCKITTPEDQILTPA